MLGRAGRSGAVDAEGVCVVVEGTAPAVPAAGRGFDMVDDGAGPVQFSSLLASSYIHTYRSLQAALR